TGQEYLPALLPQVILAVTQFISSTGRRFLQAVNVRPATLKAAIRAPKSPLGGPRARRWPWPERRHFDKRERRAVVRVLNNEIRHGSTITYSGAEEKAYCESFAAYLGGGFADAVNSGTNALYIALRALDLPPGSEVIVP